MLWRRNRLPTPVFLSSCVAQLVKNLPAMWETWVQSLSCEDPLEKGKATHSSILAWRIPWTTVHGDARSQTWLSYLHFIFCIAHIQHLTHPTQALDYAFSHWTLISTPEHDSYPQHFPVGTDTSVLVPSRCKVIRGSGWRDRLFLLPSCCPLGENLKAHCSGHNTF